MGDWVRRPEGAARESAPSGGSSEAQGGELPPALTGGDRGVGVKRGAAGERPLCVFSGCWGQEPIPAIPGTGNPGEDVTPTPVRCCWEGVFSHEPSWTDFYCLYLPVLETDEAGKDVPAKISSDSFRGYVPNRYLDAGMLMDAQHRSSAEHQSPLRLTVSKV